MTILRARRCTCVCCYFAGDGKPPYERCTTAACTSIPGVAVYCATLPLLSICSQFLRSPMRQAKEEWSQARYLLKRASTVRLGASGFVSGSRKGSALAVSVCKNGGWTGWDAGWSSGEVCSWRQVWFCARLRLRWTRLALLHRQSQNLQIKITCSYVCSILPVARLLACWKGLLLCHMLIIA